MLRMTTRPSQRIQKPSLYKIHLRTSSPWKIQYSITLTLWCFLLSILLTLPVNAQYNSVDPPECQPGDVLYCLPRQNNQYNSTDPIRLVWRTSAQPFVTQGKVNIKLWRLADSTLCGEWDGITFSDGFIIRIVNDSCFNGVVNAAAPVNSSNWQFAFRIASVNDNTSSLTNISPEFYVYKYAQSTTSSPSLVTVVSTLAPSATSVAENAASTPAASNSKSKTLTPLLIAVITGAAIAVLVAIIAIFAATRARKRTRKHQSLSTMSTSSNSPMMIRSASLLGKGRKGDHDTPMEVSSIHSTTPLAKQTSVSSFTQKLGSGGIGIITQTTTTTSTTSIKPNSIQSSVSFSDSTSAIPITASDAAMISDAFRKTLRKPEWKPTEEDDEEEEAQAGLSVEELQRRREAKELLRKELAEEGRGLQSVQRRQTKVLVHNIDEDDDTTTINTSTTLGPGSFVGGQNQENSDSV